MNDIMTVQTMRFSVVFVMNDAYEMCKLKTFNPIIYIFLSIHLFCIVDIFTNTITCTKETFHEISERAC